MNPYSRASALCLLVAACLTGACRPQRPEAAPTRMIEPRLAGPAGVVVDAPNATSVRLLETLGRAHIGRRVLHQHPDGELTEDPIWRWASTPDRYLDSALRFAVASNPDIRLVDVSSAPSLAVTVVAWQLESGLKPAADRGRRGPADDDRPDDPFGDHPRRGTGRGRPAWRPGRGSRPPPGASRLRQPLACEAPRAHDARSAKHSNPRRRRYVPWAHGHACLVGRNLLVHRFNEELGTGRVTAIEGRVLVVHFQDAGVTLRFAAGSDALAPGNEAPAGAIARCWSASPPATSTRPTTG